MYILPLVCYLVNQAAAAMAEQSSFNAETALAPLAIVPQMKAVDAIFDADCTSTLYISNLKAAHTMLQRLSMLSGSLIRRKPIKLDEALFYIREMRLCELLLSLLRRWPWAEMRQNRAVLHVGLTPLRKVLSSLYVFLCAAERVRSSQRAAAYTEMTKRCTPARYL